MFSFCVPLKRRVKLRGVKDFIYFFGELSLKEVEERWAVLINDNVCEEIWYDVSVRPGHSKDSQSMSQW